MNFVFVWLIYLHNFSNHHEKAPATVCSKGNWKRCSYPSDSCGALFMLKLSIYIISKNYIGFALIFLFMFLCPQF